jgi:hypothetical protein
MSTAELKQKLIGKITGTENEDLLLEVYRLLEIEDGDVTIYPLTDEQISIVQESQQQIKDGKFLNERDANKEIDEWLGK